MKIKTEKATYIIKKSPSIFTSRNNANQKLEDVVVFKSGQNHGVRFEGENGKFTTIARFAAEDKSVIRCHENLPSEININLLTQWGFFN